MEKFFLWSKTIQGVLLMLAPAVSSSLGYDWGGEDASAVDSVFELGAQAIGAAWALYGRLTAKAKLTVA